MIQYEEGRQTEKNLLNMQCLTRAAKERNMPQQYFREDDSRQREQTVQRL